jgi:hypothetical protein
MATNLCSAIPMATSPDQPRAMSLLSPDDELARVNRDIAEEEERLRHQAGLIALLEADGQSTILADAQLGAMESCLTALRMQREMILARTAAL